MERVKAKHRGRCSNDHLILPNEEILISFDNLTIVCNLCITDKHDPEPLYSGKFCEICFLELPLIGYCNNCYD